MDDETTNRLIELLDTVVNKLQNLAADTERELGKIEAIVASKPSVHVKPYEGKF